MINQPAEPKVSVVVPVYNGGSTIRATVECLLGQTLPPHEIIAVDDGSTDDTSEILQSFGGRITLLSQSNGGPASARNVGVLASTGDLIAFTDGDCLPDKDWLVELVKGFYAPEIAGAGGTVRGAAAGLVGEYIDMIGGLNPEFASGGVVTRLVTANACFRRDALLDVNMFEERFRKPGGEDTELSIRLRRAGYELSYAARAVVLHHHRQTVRDFLKTTANYGEGQYLIEQLWPEDPWIARPRHELIRSAIAARSMVKLGLAHRKRHDLRRAALFSFLDHYRHVAYIWGYLRGRRNHSPHGAHVLQPVETGAGNRRRGLFHFDR